MSDETSDTPNPHAFPLVNRDGWTQDGMSLRDYFAAAALQGLLASPAFWGSTFQGNMEQGVLCAYQTADLMLKERAK